MRSDAPTPRRHIGGRFAGVVAVMAAAGIAFTGVATASSSSSFPDCPVLSEGDSGSCVSMLQAELNTVLDAYSLDVDGRFGEATRIAVLDYQGRHHLGADGLVGEETASRLRQEYDATVAPAVPDLTPEEACAAIGQITGPDGGCVPDGVIGGGRSPWDCVQDLFGKDLIKKAIEVRSEESARKAAEYIPKSAFKEALKKAGAAGKAFKCGWWDLPD